MRKGRPYVPAKGKVTKIEECEDRGKELPDRTWTSQAQCFAQLGYYRYDIERHDVGVE